MEQRVLRVNRDGRLYPFLYLNDGWKVAQTGTTTMHMDESKVHVAQVNKELRWQESGEATFPAIHIQTFASLRILEI